MKSIRSNGFYIFLYILYEYILYEEQHEICIMCEQNVLWDFPLHRIWW